MEGNVFEQAPRSERIDWRQAMQAPEDVEAMLKLASLGWGAKRIANELGCSRNTVRRYLRQGGWQPYESPPRTGRLTEHAEWLAGQFRQHRGNCDVVRQELLPCTASRSACARSSVLWHICAARFWRRAWRRCATRRRPGGSCRSTSAPCACRWPTDR